MIGGSIIKDKIKKILIALRASIKFVSIISVSAILISTIIITIYKPIYKVELNGELLGYCENKSKLQEKITTYIENGDESHIAFVQIDELPEYTMCLLKKGIVTNDDEIFEKIKSLGTPYYNYFAITQDGEEKLYVASFKEAETVINELVEKESSNKDTIGIVEKYETNLQSFTSYEDAVNQLYIEKEPVKQEIVVAKSSKDVILDSLIKPISGTISSRYGAKSSIRSSAHTGLDIAAATGTPIRVAMSGKVSFAGWKGSYGKLVIVDHGDGVQTYYAHCSSILVSTGETVKQGETIAKVGTTGNSTGPHLHLEIRINGKHVNPQNYLY